MKTLFAAFLLSLTFLAQPVFAEPKMIISPLWQQDKTQTVQMLIPNLKELKMAIFERNGYTYFIFKNPHGRALGTDIFQNLPLIRLKHPNALILRGVFPSTVSPHLTAQGQILRIRMEQQSNHSNSLFKPTLVPKGLLLALQSAEPVQFKDPNTGEELIAFLTPFSPMFMNKEYKTPEFSLLPSTQGIVLYPKTDKLTLEKETQGFIVQPQNPQALTIPRPQKETPEEINWHIYGELSAPLWIEEIQKLQNFIPFVFENARHQIYTELGIAYLAQGFPTKALEALDIVPATDKTHSLKMIAYILQNKKGKALTEWEKIENPAPSIKWWKNAIDEEPLSYRLNFETRSLPPKLNAAMGRLVAGKAVLPRDFFQLSSAVERMEKSAQNTYTQQAVFYYRAQIADAQERPTEAIELYQKAANGPISNLKGLALFQKTLLELKNKKIDTQTTIQTLEKIHPLLAHTPAQIPLLQTLSNLYANENMPVQALQTDRQLLSITQDPAILARMQRRFELFFLSHTRHEPLKHAWLYSEFKELMPSGSKAVAIKEHLIYDFAVLDLLDPAYDLTMELMPVSQGENQQKIAIKAYLLARLSEDPKKITEAQRLLKNGWQKQLTDNFISELPPILRSTAAQLKKSAP